MTHNGNGHDVQHLQMSFDATVALLSAITAEIDRLKERMADLEAGANPRRSAFYQPPDGMALPCQNK